MANSKRRTRPASKGSRSRKSRAAYRNPFGTVFFVVLAVTVASTLGFFGIVASVLAGS